MKERKYTLPRHTNLAKNSSRTGAFIIDLAIFLGLTIILTYGVFTNAFKGITTPLYEELKAEQLETHLFYEDNDQVKAISGETDNDVFIENLHYYYTVYLKNLNKEITDSDGNKVEYTTEWFNKNVLGIKGTNPDAETDTGLFTYKVIEDSYATSEIGVPKESSTSSSVSEYLQKQLVPAISDIFYNIPEVYSLVSKYNFYYSLSFVLSGVISGIIIYIVLPIIFKNGVTVGKKVFKLCLANSDGYKIHNLQLLMRFMPLLVLLLSGSLPIYTSLFYIILTAVIVFLVSFTLAMASPKRSSLHDFCARTIVVDSKTSILFENNIEEEQYLNKEDNIEDIEESENGEEPGLKYEK